MDQDKVNPFVGNTETPAGGSPVSAPSTPVNPYAPTGTPYAPGSNTPAPSYADPISDSPAVPNTSAPAAYTSISPAPSVFPEPEKPKLFTKKFIIFAVIGLVLITGAVVAGIIVQNSGKSSKNTDTTVIKINDSIKNEDSTVKTAFYKYSNWILNGTNDEKISIKTSEPDSKTTYYIRKVFLGKEGDIVEYMAKANEYSNELVKSSEANSKNEEFKANVKNNNGDIEFLYDYSKNNVLSTDEILQLYTSLGKEKAISEIKSRYAIFEQMKNYNANQYVTMVDSYSKLVIDYLEDLNSNNCFINGSIDKTCESLHLSQSDQAMANNAAILEKRNEIDALIMSTVNIVVSNCWAINQGTNIAGGINE